MGWLTGALTGLKAILGTPKVASSIAETAKAGMVIWDKSKFTEQERSELTLEGGKLSLKILEATANENSLKSITRRWIACGIVGSYLFSFFVGLICILVSSPKVKLIIELVEKYQLGYLTLGVCSFYFVYYGVQGIMNKK